MKSVLSLVALGLAIGLTAPAYAGDPKTKADCEKMKDMKWDAATSKCVKK